MNPYKQQVLPSAYILPAKQLNAYPDPLANVPNAPSLNTLPVHAPAII